MERINVRVDEQLKHELEAEAREKGISPSEVVREALQEHVRLRSSKESCRELAQRIGLIGCATGLPADLSTNRDHLDGLGRG